LWRRHWVASAVLAALCGVAAALPMWIWSAAQRSAGTVDEFVARAAPPDVIVVACAPGYDVARLGLDECWNRDTVEELAAIRALPDVAVAGRGTWAFVRAGTSPDPATWDVQALFEMADPTTFPTIYGDPVVVEGRLTDPAAADELVATESGAATLGVR